MNHEPGAPPLPPEDELHSGQSRFGWGQPQTGSGNFAPPPYMGMGSASASAPGVPGYPHLPGHPPPFEGGLYPTIGFNPGILQNTAKSYMECPICFEIMCKPIYQCSNGHVICNICIDKIELCGQCRVPIAGSKIRNVALEQICESMEVKCPNQLDGCLAVVTAGQLKSHLDICEFRGVQFCSLLGFTCTQKTSALTAPTHLQSVHQAQSIQRDTFSLKLTLPQEGSATSGLLSWAPVLITSALDINIILRCLITPQGNLSLTGYLLGCSDESQKIYRVKFQIESTRSRIEWTGNLLPLRHHPSDNIPNITTFQIPFKSLSEFIKPFHTPSTPDQAGLKVKCAIWKLSEIYKMPYKDCFTNMEGEKILLEKLILPHTILNANTHSISGLSTSNFAPTIPNSFHSGSENTFSPSSSYGDTCSHCNNPLHSIIYQCLQCPEGTFLCRQCIETNLHQNHLTIRIPNVEMKPLAAVVYECASGDIN